MIYFMAHTNDARHNSIRCEQHAPAEIVAAWKARPRAHNFGAWYRLNPAALAANLQMGNTCPECARHTLPNE